MATDTTTVVPLGGTGRSPARNCACPKAVCLSCLTETALARPIHSLKWPSAMCQKLEIPVKYYRRLPDAMKATVANFDIGRLNGQSYFLRGKGNWIRAFLSA